MSIVFDLGAPTADGKRTFVPRVEMTPNVKLPVSEVQDEILVITEYGVQSITSIQARSLDHSKNLLIHLGRERR